MSPPEMQALKVVGQGQIEVQTVPLPKLRPDYILVKVAAIALNPTDWKHIEYVPISGATVGCDYAGTVIEIGSHVTKKWSKGDRIAGMAHGVNRSEKEDGCFAEYAVAKGDIQMKVPSSMSMEEASTLGIGVSTVGQGLYQSLGLPLPSAPAKQAFWVLIYGGSTATGSLAIQYAKLSGLKVVTTCGKHNFDYVESLGADAVCDYKDPDCTSKIKEMTGGELEYAFDCVSAGESPRICCEALSSRGGIVSLLDDPEDMGFEAPRENIVVKSTLAYTMTGEIFDFGEGQLPASQEDLDFGKNFWNLSTTLFADGKLKVHRPEICDGGLHGVSDGLRRLKDGRVSGVKLVYRVE